MTSVSISADVEMAIATRRSIRGFKDTPIPIEAVRHILEISSRAPSMSNTQPWKVHVLTGPALKRFTDEVRQTHRDGQEWPAEYEYYPTEWRAPYIDRRREVGWGLYSLLGIPKGDKVASHRQHERNYNFFGAPVGMIITTERIMRGGSYLDLGMFMQNIMTAARGYGIDSCPQAAFAFMHPIIRRRLALPDNEVVVCGMALGHIAPDEPANALKTLRVPVDEFTTFHDAV